MNTNTDGPFCKLGTDITEFKVAGGKAYLAPVYDTPSYPRTRTRSCTRTWAGSTSMSCGANVSRQ